MINSSLRSIGSEKYISQLLFRCTKENKKTGSAKLMMIDSTREVAPLRKSSDAYEVDTTNKTVGQCVDEIINIIEGR